VRRAAEVALRDIGADAADPDRCGHAELPIAELLAGAQAVVGAEVLLDGCNVPRRELEELLDVESQQYLGQLVGAHEAKVVAGQDRPRCLFESGEV